MDHAWAWFEYHAHQRASYVRLYFLVTAAIAAAYATTLIEGLLALSCLIAFAGHVASISFLTIDQRGAALIKIGEEAIDALERTLANELQIDALCIIQKVDNIPKQRFASHGQAFRLLYRSVAWAFGVICGLNTIWLFWFR